MGFLSAIVSTFFVNYLAMIIINRLPIAQKRLWTTIIISVADLAEIIFYVIFMITAFQNIDAEGAWLSIVMYLTQILAVVVAYLCIMGMVFSGTSIFKSRRLRKFEAEANGKDSRNRIIVGAVLLGLGVCLLGLGIILLVKTATATAIDNTVLITGIVSIVVGVIGIVFGMLYLMKKSKYKDYKANIMLLVNENGNLRSFICDEKASFSEACPKICDTYLLDDFGALITDEKHFTVKGIKIDKLDMSLLKNSKLYEVNTLEFGEALSKFEKYRKQKITINAQKEIVKIINIK